MPSRLLHAKVEILAYYCVEMDAAQASNLPDTTSTDRTVNSTQRTHSQLKVHLAQQLLQLRQRFLLSLGIGLGFLGLASGSLSRTATFPSVPCT